MFSVRLCLELRVIKNENLNKIGRSLTGHLAGWQRPLEAVHVNPESRVGPSRREQEVLGQSEQTDGVCGLRDGELKLDLSHGAVERRLGDAAHRSGRRKRIEIRQNRVTRKHVRRQVVEGLRDHDRRVRHVLRRLNQVGPNLCKRVSPREAN